MFIDEEILIGFDLDSGLSLTTARDATEVDSDQEIKANNAEQLRLLISRKDKDATESDDVFREVGIFMKNALGKTSIRRVHWFVNNRNVYPNDAY